MGSFFRDNNRAKVSILRLCCPPPVSPKLGVLDSDKDWDEVSHKEYMNLCFI